MKNVWYLIIGLFIGVVIERTGRMQPAPVVMQPPQPQRKSRTLQELAPVIATDKMDVTQWGSAEAYVEYVKTLVSQVVQDGLSEKEAHLASEAINEHLWHLVGYDHSLELRRDAEHIRRADQWVEEIEESTYQADEKGDE